MNTRIEEIERLTEKIAETSKNLGYSTGFDECLLSASNLIEAASDILATREQGNRVTELLLLAARVESLTTSSSEP